MTFRELVGFGTGAGGGGFIVPDSAIIPFADVAARNTWAAANLPDLIQNQTVVEVTDTPQNTWYLWRGETNPASHDPANWIDATPILRGPQGIQGATGAEGPMGTPGADGIQGLFVRDDGNQLAVLATIFDFTGEGVTASGNGVLKTINVPGGIDGVTVQNDGLAVGTTGTILNFTGDGVTASGTGDQKMINIPGGTAAGGIDGLIIQDEGSALFTEATALNFTGAGVTATGTTATKTINIPGGAFSGFAVQDEGVEQTSTAMTLNFVGAGVTATAVGNTVTITVGGVPGAAMDFYHGLSDSDNPASVDLGTLTSQSIGTGGGQQFTFQVGPSTAGQYIILLVPQLHDINSLVNTGTGFEVLNTYTPTDNVRTISTVSYKSYTHGPLNPNLIFNYRATLA